MNIPNQSGAVFGPTAGIARNMQWNIGPQGQIEPLASGAPGTGGGDLNGTASTSILMYQAGTNATRWQMPRKAMNPGNYCGVV
jgi:hypothetical protein